MLIDSLSRTETALHPRLTSPDTLCIDSSEDLVISNVLYAITYCMPITFDELPLGPQCSTSAPVLERGDVYHLNSSYRPVHPVWSSHFSDDVRCWRNNDGFKV